MFINFFSKISNEIKNIASGINSSILFIAMKPSVKNNVFCIFFKYKKYATYEPKYAQSVEYEYGSVYENVEFENIDALIKRMDKITDSFFSRNF